MSREHPEVIDALVALCREMGARTVIQIGAEDGYEGDSIAATTKARVVAIDPDPQCHPCTARIEWYPVVIGATDGQTIMYMNDVMGLSTQLKRGKGADERPIEMPQKRLDTLCREIDASPDVLIIDTEGTTMDVLEGSTGIIDGVRMIHAECQVHEIRPGVRLLPEVDAWLTARGFVQREGLPAYCDGGQGNFVWVRP